MDSETEQFNNIYWQFIPKSGAGKFSILTHAGKLKAIQVLAERGKFEGKDYEIQEISIPQVLQNFCADLLAAEGQIVPQEGGL